MLLAVLLAVQLAVQLAVYSACELFALVAPVVLELEPRTLEAKRSFALGLPCPRGLACWGDRIVFYSDANLDRDSSPLK